MSPETPHLSDKNLEAGPNESNVLDIKGHTGNENAIAVDDVDLTAYDYTEEESRAITRMFDWHILPFIWCESSIPYTHMTIT